MHRSASDNGRLNVASSCCWWLFILTLLTASLTHAGLLSSLSKLGKAAKQGDIDAPDIRAHLPEGVSADDVATIRLNNAGQWEIHGKDGARQTFHDLDSDTANPSPKAVILDSFYLPKDLDVFHNIPKDLPILIRTKNSRVFELQRPEPNLEVTADKSHWRLNDRAVTMKVHDNSSLRKAIWHLEKPILMGSPRLLSIQYERAIQSETNKKPDALSDETGRLIHPTEIKAADVISSLDSMKRETVVLAGRLDNTNMHFGSHESLDLASLKKAAEDNDINLVLLNTSKPEETLNRLAMQLTLRDRNDTSVGTFFNHYIGGITPDSKDTKAIPMMELERSPSGDSQVVVQWKTSERMAETQPIPTAEDRSNIEWIAHLAVHSLLHNTLHNGLQNTEDGAQDSIQLYHPDEARSDELESRIIPGVHSFIQIYLITSAFFGFMALITSWRAWNYLWKPQRPTRWWGWLLFLVIWPMHKVLFLIAFLPIAGFFTFWYIVLSTFWKVISFVMDRLLIRPIRWVLTKVSH